MSNRIPDNIRAIGKKTFDNFSIDHFDIVGGQSNGNGVIRHCITNNYICITKYLFVSILDLSIK